MNEYGAGCLVMLGGLFVICAAIALIIVLVITLF